MAFWDESDRDLGCVGCVESIHDVSEFPGGFVYGINMGEIHRIYRTSTGNLQDIYTKP
jgi:hypothetical protein